MAAASQRLKLAFVENKGRMGPKAPYLIPDGYCEEAVNVEFWLTALGVKRRGSAAVAGGYAYPASQTSLVRHVPGSDTTLAELWAIGPSLYRYAAALSGFTAVTSLISTVYATRPSATSLNGKLFIQGAGNNTVVWDGATTRYAGMGPAAVPTVADTGSGSYAATARYYKVAYTAQSSGVTLRRGELSYVTGGGGTAFTPSGSGASATVTKPAALTGFGETHWELYASPDDLTYYLIATIAVGTTTYVDSALPSAYTGAQPPLVGWNLPLPGATYFCVDGNRLVMAGNLNTSQPRCRVWWTPRLGTSVGDDERVPQTLSISNYVDVGENDGDTIMGISPRAINGTIYVFKRRHIYKMVATGDVNTPYTVFEAHSSVGTINNKSVVVGETESGDPAIYFLSVTGPYRISPDGVEFIGADILDIYPQTEWVWTAVAQNAHGVYYESKRQVWWWVPDPVTTDHPVAVYRRFKFDVRLFKHQNALVLDSGHGGWSYDTGLIAEATVSCIFSENLAYVVGALKPYAGRSTVLYVCDAVNTYLDGATAFQGYITLPIRMPAGAMRRAEMLKPEVMAAALAGQSLKVTTVGDLGLYTATATVSLAPTASETRVIRKAEGAQMGNLTAVQYTIGDASAVSSNWNIDALAVEGIEKEPR